MFLALQVVLFILNVKYVNIIEFVQIQIYLKYFIVLCK